MADGDSYRSRDAPRIRFADCELDPNARELRVGGAPLAMQPRVLDLLLYLIEHRDRAVSKDELYEHVWGGVSVAETALTQAAKELRRAVGDDGHQQQVIQTVRRFGYRFVAELASSPSLPAASPREEPYIGRVDLLSTIDADLEAAARGVGGALLLAGEPGIGKSRTLTELAIRARGRGLPVFEGRGARDEGAPPFWPWLQIVRAAIAHRERVGGEELASLVARSMPELHASLGGGKPPEAWRLEADQARFRLFQAMQNLLTELAPAVLVVDDLHDADVPSLRLLAHILRNRDAKAPLFAGAYRDASLHRDETRREILAAITRAPQVRVVVLDGFGHEEIAACFESIRGDAPAAPVLRSLEERTRGNPFFLVQTLRLWRDRALEPGRVGPLPGGVRDAIEQHLEVLSREAREALRMAAVMGAGFDPALLVGLEGSPASPGSLDEAVAAGVLVRTSAADGGLRFAHTLIRETLAESLTAPRKLEVHRALIDAIQRSGRSHAVELAHHAYEAARLGGDAEAAATYAEAAAVECAGQHAFEEEARHLERGLEALGFLAAPDEEHRLRLMLRLARSRVHSSDPDGGLAVYARVSERALELGIGPILARAAIGYEEAGFAVAERYLFDPAAIRYLEGALRLLDESSTDLRAHVESRLARRLLYRGDHGEAAAMARRAAERATRGVSPRVAARTLESLVYVLWRPDQLPDRVAAARQMLDAALRDDDLATVLDAQGLLMLTLLEGGDLEGMRPIVADVERLYRVERYVSPWRRWMFRLSQGMLSQLEGRFADAELILGQLDELARGLRRADAPVALAAQRFQLRWWQGRGEEESAILGWLATERYPRVILAATGYALLGRLEEARPCYERALGHGVEAPERDVRSPQALVGLATACVALRDPKGAPPLYRQLLPWRSHDAVMRPMATYSGSIERYLAGLAEIAGEPVAAREHWERSLSHHVAVGAAPWATLDRIGLADLLLRTNPRKEAPRIAELASTATHGAESLGSAMLAAEVERLESFRRDLRRGSVHDGT
jgi:DNA-binding winged helix-turn-helix (wHTH) protein